MNRIYVRPERCQGCKSCELACAVQHSHDKTLLSAVSQFPPPQKRLYVESAGEVRMPVLCRHCDEAPCLNSCITGCLYKDDNGYVRRHKGRCIGCWSCIMTCPFGVISRDPYQHIAVKCDRCHKLDTPACVSACPTKALELVEVDELPAEMRHRVVLTETGIALD
ncbi:MAG: 4Fe-4S dicluster domain-containing protein [Deltaproteobacteria bacterium]